MEELDKRLKEKLLNYGRYVVASVYDSDRTRRKRRNIARTKRLMEIIRENGFEYKSFREEFPDHEKQVFFVVYGDLEKFKTLIEEQMKKLRLVNYYDNLGKLLEGKHFHHPQIRAEKDEYLSRKEIFLEDLYESPESVGVWKVDSCYGGVDDVYIHYYRLNPYRHCIISKVKAGYRVSIGTTIPCGATIFQKVYPTLEEALNVMKTR